MKSFFLKTSFIVFLLAAPSGLRAGETSSPEARVQITPEFLDGLVAEARERNPALAAANARAVAAGAAVDAVRTWEDPLATVGVSLPTSRGFKSSEEGNLIYGIEQKLPVFDRPKLVREAATADAIKEKLTVGYETALVRRDLTLAMVAVALADATIDLARQDLGWLDATLAAVDHRYRVGKATQLEWLKIQTERAKVTDHIRTLELEREHQQVELNRILNRDLHGAWPEIELPAAPTTQVREEDLVAAAAQAEPKLKVMQQGIAKAEATSRVTREQRRPEVGVGVQGRSYTGDGGFREGMVTVSFSLPWLNAGRYASDYARDRAKARVSEHEAADYALGLREEIHHQIIELDAAHRQTVLYRDELIPLTEQTLSSASAAWANNLGPFQDILDARRMLVDHRLLLAQALADQAHIHAELSLLTGSRELARLPQTTMPVDKVMNMSEASK